jgi:hypothetical protein
MSRNARADQHMFILSSFTQSDMVRLAVFPGRESLTEAEKIDIIHHHWNGLGPVAINLKVKQLESTIRTCTKAYENHGAFFPRHGRPAAPPPTTSVVDTASDQLFKSQIEPSRSD